jgi:hypothetical protein
MGLIEGKWLRLQERSMFIDIVCNFCYISLPQGVVMESNKNSNLISDAVNAIKDHPHTTMRALSGGVMSGGLGYFCELGKQMVQPSLNQLPDNVLTIGCGLLGCAVTAFSHFHREEVHALRPLVEPEKEWRNVFNKQAEYAVTAMFVTGAVLTGAAIDAVHAGIAVEKLEEFRETDPLMRTYCLMMAKWVHALFCKNRDEREAAYLNRVVNKNQDSYRY